MKKVTKLPQPSARAFWKKKGDCAGDVIWRAKVKVNTTVIVR